MEAVSTVAASIAALAALAAVVFAGLTLREQRQATVELREASDQLAKVAAAEAGVASTVQAVAAEQSRLVAVTQVAARLADLGRRIERAELIAARIEQAQASDLLEPAQRRMDETFGALALLRAALAGLPRDQHPDTQALAWTRVTSAPGLNCQAARIEMEAYLSTLRPQAEALAASADLSPLIS